MRPGPLGESGSDDGRGAWAWWGLVLLPFLVQAVAHWSLLPFREAGDYAQYMLHAKAIAHGRPYGDIGYLYTPLNLMIGPRVQPPGWPLLLAPGVRLFGTGLLFPKVLVTLCTMAFLAFAARRLSDGDSKWIAGAAVGAAGAGLEAVFATNTALSDLPFAMLLWGAILVADARQALTWRRLLLLGAVGSYAMATRVIGVVLVPTLLLLALVRPRDRSKLLALVGAWAVVALVAVLVIGVDHVPFLKLAMRGPEVILGRFATMWDKYRYGILESLLYPTPWDRVNDVYHVAALVVLPVGMVDFAQRYGRSALGCLVLCYVLMMGAAPVADLRYLWPLWPVIAYGMVAGTRRVVGWLPRLDAGVRTRVVAGLTALVLAGSVGSGVLREGRPSLLSRADVQELFAWVRSERARDQQVRLVFISPRVLSLYTGAPAMGYFRGSEAQAAQELEAKRITHVVLGDAGTVHPPIDGLDSLMTRRPAAFEVTARFGEFTVYRLHAPLDGAS